MKASLQVEGPHPAPVAPGHGQENPSPTATHVMLIIKSHISEATGQYEAAQDTGMELYSLPKCLKWVFPARPSKGVTCEPAKRVGTHG